MKGVGAKKNNERSFDLLLKLLKDVDGDPEAYIDDAKLEHAVRTQKGTAAYERHERGISGSSLNTIRRLCERGYGGISFDDFDLLRVRARNALLKHKAGMAVEHQSVNVRAIKKSDSRDALRLRVSSLKMEQVAAIESAIHASAAFFEALRICRDLANYITDIERINTWKKEEKELLAMFSLHRRFDGKW